VLVETFLRKQLGLKAHTVTKVEETERYMIVHIDESAQVHKSTNANSGHVFGLQLIADLGIQHPLRHCDLHTPGEFDDQNYRCAFP
jgi:hypothetical protein